MFDNSGTRQKPPLSESLKAYKGGFPWTTTKVYRIRNGSVCPILSGFPTIARNNCVPDCEKMWGQCFENLPGAKSVRYWKGLSCQIMCICGCQSRRNMPCRRSLGPSKGQGPARLRGRVGDGNAILLDNTFGHEGLGCPLSVGMKRRSGNISASKKRKIAVLINAVCCPSRMSSLTHHRHREVAPGVHTALSGSRFQASGFAGGT